MKHYLTSTCLAVVVLLGSLAVNAQTVATGNNTTAMPAGDALRGRLLFAPCRTCHYAESFMGHNNGPNLNRIFGKVAGKQADFKYYSSRFKNAQFVWTPEFMFAWLENPRRMFPDSTMMSLGLADPQQRADLVAFLQKASVRDSAVTTEQDKE
jgi:cytochrome c